MKISKARSIVLSLAIAGIALTSVVTPASASKMNGKCCQWSDGGRSFRYRMATAWIGQPHTCSARAAQCLRVASELGMGDRFEKCGAAKALCLRTGTYIGPYSGYQLTAARR
jgi:hypothetical protein